MCFNSMWHFLSDLFLVFHAVSSYSFCNMALLAVARRAPEERRDGWRYQFTIPSRGLVLAGDTVHRSPAREKGATFSRRRWSSMRACTVLLLLAGVGAGKPPTTAYKGFYSEKICGTVFTDRCKAISTRIVCGQVRPYATTFLITILNRSEHPD